MVEHPINVLSLCAGIGGLDLGVRLALPGARTVCYVEIEAYACAVLAQQMENQTLDPAPVWTDLTAFDGRAWRGIVDLVVAGFPCQPWSCAGAHGGIEDDRWIWPDIVRIIRDVGPSIVFLENVPGLLTGGLGHILGDLAGLGFDAGWDVFSAAEVGASHLRRRLFILAHASGAGLPIGEIEDAWHECPTAERGGAPLADDSRIRRAQGWPKRERYAGGSTGTGRGVPFPPGPADAAGWKDYLTRFPDLEPAVRRGSDGIPDRVDRLRALGNAVVPEQAAHAFRELLRRLHD